MAGDCLNYGKKIEPLTIHRATGPENARWRILGIARELSLPFDLVKLDMDHVMMSFAKGLSEPLPFLVTRPRTRGEPCPHPAFETLSRLAPCRV